MSAELTVWVLYVVFTVFEVLALSIRSTKMVRISLSAVLILMLSVVHTALLLQEPLAFGIPLFIVGIYRVINILRFSTGRMHDSYLYKSVGRTSMILGLYQFILGALSLIVPALPFRGVGYMYGFTALLTVIYVAVSRSFIKTLQSAKIVIDDTKQSKLTQPSVTVAIPARNETTELQSCIESVIASSYQKLEILVLDDCSHDTTSDIIKKFAHDGVRFIQGDEPGDTWLAKNAAYERLLREANGELVLFCGVDVRFTKDTIAQLVAYKTQQNLAMISVLPKKDNATKQQSMVQFARYMWELVIPRKIINRPPVLSTVLLADKSALLKLGGFSSVKRMIVPEAYFAKQLQKTGGYRFIISDQHANVCSTKSRKQQMNTAVRIRYPQLRKRPENVLGVSIVLISLFLGPLGIVIFGYYANQTPLLVSGIVLVVLQLYIYSMLARKTGQAFIVRIVLYALTVPVVDLCMMHYSMFAYEFGTVSWKERNVCLPVMHVTPSLPKLAD